MAKTQSTDTVTYEEHEIKRIPFRYNDVSVDSGPSFEDAARKGFSQTNLKYPRILRYVASTPWAIEPSRLLDIVDVLNFKANGGQLSEAEIREYCGLHKPTPYQVAHAIIRAGNLSDLLNRLIDDRSGGDNEERQRIIGRMARAAGISESTVGQILRGEIQCPPISRLEGFARVLRVPVKRLQDAAESDGCEYGAGDEAISCPTPLAAVGSRSNGSAVAVIPLKGIISHHINHIRDMSGPGGTSVEGFRERLRAALNAREVGSVIIDIDSPGGSVEGVQELADEILSLRGDKPITAVANSLAASAAFWIGSAADEFSVIPSGQVGSIGVFAAHEDISQKLEDEGVKVTLVHAGKFKTEGSPFEPLSEEAQAHIQERVDVTFQKFVAAVADGRGVDVSKVERDFGQGRLVDADTALEVGMVDRIETLEQAINRMRGVRSKDSMRAETELRRQALAFT